MTTSLLLLQAEQKGVDLGGDNLTIQQKINRVLNDRDFRRQATGGRLISRAAACCAWGTAAAS